MLGVNRLARLSLIPIVLFACVGCDQVTKQVVREHIALGASQSFMGDTLRLTHAENPGAFLSMGASLPEGARVAVFQVGASILIIGIGSVRTGIFNVADVLGVAGFLLLILFRQPSASSETR